MMLKASGNKPEAVSFFYYNRSKAYCLLNCFTKKDLEIFQIFFRDLF